MKRRVRADPDLGYFPITSAEFRQIFGAVLESDLDFDALGWYESVKDELDEFISQYNEKCQLEDWEKIDHIDDFAVAYKKFLDPDYRILMRRCTGSTKMVFILRGGYALKIGIGDGYLDQEIDVSENNPDLTCFPRLISRSKRKSSALMELVIVDDIPSEYFEKTFGLNMANTALRCGAPFVSYHFKASERLQDQDSKVLKFEYEMKQNKDPKWQSLRDLRAFMKNNMPLNDISDHNWGLVRRDGEKIPVVYDYDF